MSDFEKYFTNDPKQERSYARVEKILDAVDALASSKPPKKISIKEIAKNAFISVGAIYHHFPSLNSIFASLLIRKINIRTNELIAFIDSQKLDTTLEKFADTLVDNVFNFWINQSPPEKKESLRFFYQNAKFPELFYSFARNIYPNIKEFISKNNTGTFREISENEWPLLVRLSQTALISPFMESLPIAGTPEHKKIAKDTIVKSFGA
jgi:AcrR family transcriptional regulator